MRGDVFPLQIVFIIIFYYFYYTIIRLMALNGTNRADQVSSSDALKVPCQLIN